MSDHNDAHLSDAVTKEFTAAGYKDDHIAIILARQESLKHERTRDQGETWVKIHRGQILPETLDAYQLPWEWDKNDPNFIILKRWISEDVQEELFAHTRRLREQRLGGLQAGLADYERIRKRKKDRKRHDEILRYFGERAQPKRRYTYVKGE
ncbi:uncharacterized protein ACHE_60861S [Aspergillus chevalieri]|uniref:Uncharacterized protein n=1 Tax=Aspergillus chevalieri TaxID=182096 RepID=A0A7R7VUD8_ASPCH|nr:uncharacterized protein ACHE_60861S [Aspergillus chevalieri]BCR90975.1 hypothetical protein ACHE_60861S [Aspergillus chevalieri]